MEQEQTPKQLRPEDTETIQIEERDAKREFNTETAPVLRYGTWGGTHEKQCKLLLKLYLKLYRGNTNTHRKAPKPHQTNTLISMLKNKEASTCIRPLFASSWAAGT